MTDEQETERGILEISAVIRVGPEEVAKALNDLVRDLRGPMYSYTLSRSDFRPGADKRQVDAMLKIDAAVRAYVKRTPE